VNLRRCELETSAVPTDTMRRYRDPLVAEPVGESGLRKVVVKRE
jgi:hypothetical protein